MRPGTERAPALRCEVQLQTLHLCSRALVAHIRDAHDDTGRFTCSEHLHRVLREMRRDCAPARAFIVTFLGDGS
jgi:hypothetical protein